MDVQTIKSNYSMTDILNRLNITVNRNGFCKCVFHSEDTASMKIYPKSFYCFGCGKGGDIINFVKDYQGIPFKDACEWISGENLTRQTRLQMSAAVMRTNKRKEKEKRIRAELKEVNSSFDGLWNKILNSEPLSDERAETYNKWQLLVYKQESLLEELGAI